MSREMKGKKRGVRSENKNEESRKMEEIRKKGRRKRHYLLVETQDKIKQRERKGSGVK